MDVTLRTSERVFLLLDGADNILEIPFAGQLSGSAFSDIGGEMPADFSAQSLKV